MAFTESLPDKEMVNETIKFSDVTGNVAMEELSSKTCCKYYSVEEYQKLPENNNMNIFHTNINGLESKLDNLHEFISGSQPKLDILAITETSEQEKVWFLQNVEIKGYKIFHTASKTSKGGTAVYVDENVNSIERIDLNILHDEFEGAWVEIKNKHSKNIICACIYRHPHNNFKEIFQYLEMCLSKLNKESFRDDLSIQNWDLTLNNVNDSFKDFHMKLEGAVNRHAPMRKLNPKEIKIKNKPWMTPHIVKNALSLP